MDDPRRLLVLVCMSGVLVTGCFGDDSGVADGALADAPVADGPTSSDASAVDAPPPDAPPPDAPLPDGNVVGSLAPCLVGGNVLYLNGEEGDYIHPGIDTIQGATWQGYVDSAAGRGTISANAFDLSQGDWNTVFWSPDGQPLVPGVYEMAQRAAVPSPDHPGLDIYGQSRGCNELTGRFQIFEVDNPGDVLNRFSATFEQYCGTSSAALRGCVHFEAGWYPIDAGVP